MGKCYKIIFHSLGEKNMIKEQRSRIIRNNVQLTWLKSPNLGYTSELWDDHIGTQLCFAAEFSGEISKLIIDRALPSSVSLYNWHVLYNEKLYSGIIN